MATTKPKKTAAKKPAASASKPKSKSKAPEKSVKTIKAEKVVKPVAEEKPAVKTAKACSFFAKKCDANENILTIFKDKKIWGALIAEAVGAFMLAPIMIMFGAGAGFSYILVVAAIIMAAHALSGAHLNPIITAGMMVTRRVSVIRGVLYIIAQVIGAWLGVLLLSAFRGLGGNLQELPTMTAITADAFWATTLIELIGAIIIGFCYGRALQYKRSALTFAVVVAGGIGVAFMICYALSAGFLGVQGGNFILNPATALMMQIFPTAGETVGEVLGGIGLALAAYIIFPMVGGILGFFVSDLASKFAGEKVCDCEK